MAESRPFLGRGWGFPPSFDQGGRDVRMVEGEEDIRQSLALLLATSLGERVLRPAFGWRRETLLFEPLSTSLATLLRHEIETAVLFFEPRIKLDRLAFQVRPDAEGLIEIRLDYRVKATNSRSNLVFPFYLDEANNL
jgi:phage baseplate assembly protein W